jgi:hypothetical protein
MNGTQSAWTDELVQKTTALWAKHSAQEISDIIFREDGVFFSRSAIVSKLSRLGLLNTQEAEGRRRERDKERDKLKKRRRRERHKVEKRNRAEQRSRAARGSKTSAAYRMITYGRAPEMTKAQMREEIARALRNTQAMG